MIFIEATVGGAARSMFNTYVAEWCAASAALMMA